MTPRTIQIIMLAMLNIPMLIFGQQGEQLSLEDCIQLGLEHNQSLQINRFETDRSISQAKSNIGMVLPTVNFSLSSANTDFVGTGWVGGYSSSLSLRQNIWDGGAWYNSLKSAKVALEAADTQYRSNGVNTVYEVKAAFYRTLSAQKLLVFYRENMATSEYQHQLTLERFKLGASSQNDTLRTRVNIERARLQILNGELDQQQKIRDLNIMLGREWDSPLTLAEPILTSVKVPSLSAAVDEVLGENLQLQLLDKNKTVATYNIKIARAGYIPSLGFSASYQNRSLDIADIFADQTSTLSTGLTLNWNLFNGTRTSRGVQQSKISAKIARENYDLSKRKIKKELAQTLETMETLQKSVEISKLILDSSEQDLLLAQEQYKIGSLSILDVLRITVSYEDAKSNLIRTRYNLKIAEAGLHQLMGRH